MTNWATASVLVVLGLASSAVAGDVYRYDPVNPSDPFDTVGQSITQWLSQKGLVKRVDDWQQGFCSCMENGYISSWYQYASVLYVMESCSPSQGLVLRSGHMQDRHKQPLQAAMSCDVLKLITYCTQRYAPEAMPMWNSTCREAHYTVPRCDVDCSAAMPRASAGTAAFAAMAALGVALLSVLGA